jgi:hypothetical protein
VTWFSNHFAMLFGGIAGTAVVALVGWLLKSLWKPAPQIEAKIEKSRLAESAVATGSNNTQHLNSHNLSVTLPFLPSGAPGRERYDEWRELTNELHEAFVQIGYVSPFASEGFSDPRTEDQRSKSLEAFVLKFENRKSDSDRKLGRALHLIAKMKFHHKNGVTARDIDYGVWLNSPCNSTDMGIGDTRELVLMAVLGDGLVTFEDRRIDNRDFADDEGFGYVDFPDIEGYGRVDITLIDQNSQASLSTNLKFWREGANFSTSEL